MPKVLGFKHQLKGYFFHHFSSEKTIQFGLLWRFNLKGRTTALLSEHRTHSPHWMSSSSEEYITETGVDSSIYVTIASACIKVYLTNFLPFSQNMFTQQRLNQVEKKVGAYDSYTVIDSVRVVFAHRTLDLCEGSPLRRCTLDVKVCLRSEAGRHERAWVYGEVLIRAGSEQFDSPEPIAPRWALFVSLRQL